MDNAFLDVEEQFTQMIGKYKKKSLSWLNAIEHEIGKDGRELIRKMLQAHINCRGDGNIGDALTTTDDIVLTHKRLIKRTLHTLFGAIEINRTGYSLRDYTHLFPLDAALNLPATSFSYGLQRFIARRIATNPFSEVIDLTEEISGLQIGNRQVSEMIIERTVDFDAYYTNKNQPRQNKQHEILVLTTDGKGIVMRHEALRENTQQRAVQSKYLTASSKHDKTNRKRMAQVASVYWIKKFNRTPSDILNELRKEKTESRRPRPENKRVWASIEKDSKDVILSMFQEASARDPKHKKPWVILIDGNKPQLKQVKSLVKQTGANSCIILDIIHVIEYLWDVARIFNDATNHVACEQWVYEKLTLILNDEAATVAGSIRMSAAKRKLNKADKKIIADSARYIAQNKSRMEYKKYLKNGYPIATGVIEGACRYLIKDRMDITGARWGLNGAESVLKLRSLVTSGDFDEYWEFHLKNEYERNHAAKIANLDRLERKISS